MHINPKQRHMQAMMAPRGPAEEAMMHLLQAMRCYAAGLKAKQIDANDEEQRKQLTDAVVAGCHAATVLMSGPLGRLDQDLLRDEFTAVLRDCGETADIVSFVSPAGSKGASAA